MITSGSSVDVGGDLMSYYYIQIDGSSSVTVGGDIKRCCSNGDFKLEVLGGSSLEVAGDISTQYEIKIVNASTVDVEGSMIGGFNGIQVQSGATAEVAGEAKTTQGDIEIDDLASRWME